MCCEMLLRHNWVGEARANGRVEAFRSMFSRCFDVIFSHSDRRGDVLPSLFAPDTFYVCQGQ